MASKLMNPEVIRTALFVDFDNIYLSLKRHSAEYAKAFASGQEKWLPYLENSLRSQKNISMPDGAVSVQEEPAEYARRKILIRRCYLNPDSFREYRPFFTTSAFEVVDCPPVTGLGKTSTDIHLVMDVMDVLNHPVRYDEFIILSGDADFAPLLRRVRMHDRSSTILSAGNTSKAYIASSDYVIPLDDFLRDALGINLSASREADQIAPKQIDPETGALLHKIADLIYDEAVDPSGIQSSDLPSIFENSEGFSKEGNWLGFFTLRRLTEAIVSQREDLILVDGDPWRVARKDAPEEHAVDEEAAECRQDDDLDKALSDCIIQLIAAADKPVPLARLASTITNRFGPHQLGNNWAGTGSFKNLLKRLDLDGLKIATAIPGYVYDPARHKAPELRSYKKDEFMDRYPDIAPLAYKINQLTDAPYLTPEGYALMLKEIAREINDTGYHLTATPENVRDRCAEEGAAVSMSQVRFVLIECGNAGHWFIHGRESAEKLAEIMAKRVIDLCSTVRLELSEMEVDMVKHWITGTETAILRESSRR